MIDATTVQTLPPHAQRIKRTADQIVPGELVTLTARGRTPFEAWRPLPAEPGGLTDLERKLLEEFGEEIGAPSGLAAENLSIPVAEVTKAAKDLAARGLLEDTGYAMKRRADGHWDWINKPKTEGGMRSKPGASTVWKTAPAGHAMLGAQQR